jgi:hypothetical protein
MQPAYAHRFEGLSETEIDGVLESFAFRNCRPAKICWQFYARASPLPDLALTHAVSRRLLTRGATAGSGWRTTAPGRSAGRVPIRSAN